MRPNTPSNTPDEPSEGFSLTRRQVATAAAWSVPVVAFAVGTPAAAATLQPIPWEEALYGQWGTPVQFPALSTTTTAGNISAQVVTNAKLYNASSLEAVPPSAATITVFATLTGSGTRLPAGALVILDIKYMGASLSPVGAGTSSVSFTNPAGIPIGGSLDLEVVWGVAPGTVGVVTTNLFTQWTITVTGTAGDGTYKNARIYDFVGTSV